MFHDSNTEQGECFSLETDTNEETSDLILNRTRPRQEQSPFPTPLPPPPCPSKRSRELHIRRLENDMIKQGAPDPFLAAFIKCTSDHSESSDADSDWSSRRSRGRASSPSSPRNVLWQQVKAYFSSRARKERRRKSRRSRVGSIGRDSGDDRSRASSSSVYVHTRYN